MVLLVPSLAFCNGMYIDWLRLRVVLDPDKAYERFQH